MDKKLQAWVWGRYSDNTFSLSWVLRIFMLYVGYIAPLTQWEHIVLFWLLDISQYLVLTAYYDVVGRLKKINTICHEVVIGLASIVFYVKACVVLFGVLLGCF